MTHNVLQHTGGDAPDNNPEASKLTPDQQQQLGEGVVAAANIIQKPVFVHQLNNSEIDRLQGIVQTKTTWAGTGNGIDKK